MYEGDAERRDVPLTTMHYGVDEVADHAVKRLLDLIGRTGNAPDPQRTLIEPKLIIRESCGAALRASRPSVRSQRPKATARRDGSRARVAARSAAAEPGKN